MEKRKILVFYSPNAFGGRETYNLPHIAKIFNEFEQYGANVEYVLDVSNESATKPGSPDYHRIEKEGPEWVSYSEEQLEAVKDAEVLLVEFHCVSSKLLEAAKKLKFVGVMRSGVEGVNIPACTEKGITVSYAPGRTADAVADYAVALMLGFNRHISQRDMSHSHEWLGARARFHPPLIRESTVGIVGFGCIGKLVAKRLIGFGPKMIAYDPYANEDEAKALGVELLSLEEVMSQSDFVSLHARLLPSTEGLIGAKELSLMKPTAVFVNTARGRLVDQEALIEVLKENKIRGAALDVFSDEPLASGHPLFDLDNVILTPHAANKAGDMVTISIQIVTEELHRYFKGEKLLNRAN